MKIFETVRSLREFLSESESGSKIGFVPTMGALHEGHLALIKKSLEENSLSVCSIFVNPTQFNDPEDLKNYPRPIESDIEKLKTIGCDVLFLPSVKEIYPEATPKSLDLDLGKILDVMEGKHRPGHFAGVMTVVKRLFDIVDPDRAYFGEKDFQQMRVIQQMVEKLQMKVDVIPCPTIRESDGLAMSSRNIRLSAEERKIAVSIPAALSDLKQGVKKFPEKMNEILQNLQKKLFAETGSEPEYFEIVEEKSLQKQERWTDLYPLRACIALKIGKIRLIDNIQL